ncbi:MAG: hypothetical protein RRA92_05660 [Gemmatimonadota bacterium]|nr:hypothetical protein [Gemmatimonadota bacterium]
MIPLSRRASAAVAFCVTVLAFGCGGDDDPVSPQPSDAAPQLVITSAPQQAGIGERVIVGFTATDDRGLASLAVDWGDGGAAESLSLSGTSFSDARTHVYESDGTFAARFDLTDSGGQTASATRQIVVVDGVPVLTLTVPSGAVPGEPVSASFSASDDVGLEELVIDWGDGTTPDTVPGEGQAALVGTRSHTFAETGTFALVATLRSVSEQTAVAEATISVATLSCVAVDLAVGESAAIVGTADANCIELPAAAGGEEYEVVVTPLGQTLGFNPLELQVSGATATTSVAGPSNPAAATAPRFAAGAALGASPVEQAWRRGQTDLDRQLRELERPLLPQIRANAAAAGGFGLFAVPAVGDTLDFNFSCISSAAFPNAPDSITAVVTAVSDRAVILEDTAATGAFTMPEYQEIGVTFDSLIWDTDVAYFGAPADVDANGGRVVILYSAGVNRLSESYLEGFVAGFFCGQDLGFAGGNDAEMFYVMVPDSAGVFTPADGDGLTKTQVRRFTDNTIAHEFQHLINAQAGGGGAFDVWLNEGLSHLAEEVVGHALTGFEPGTELTAAQLTADSTKTSAFNKFYINNWFNLARYLDSPTDTAALLNSTDPGGFNTFRMRGAAWSFVRYLLDRFEDGTAAEALRTRNLIASAASSSRAAIAAEFGVPFEELVADWAAMFAVEDRADVPAAPTLALPSYRMRDIYESSNIGAAVNPVAGPGYPLAPVTRILGMASTTPADLFTATGLYVRLTAPGAADPTRLRLLGTGGAALEPSVAPTVVVVRTK